jgi:L-alanine-DL-glutamate epimerase-like enolase superfamily enzyme
MIGHIANMHVEAARLQATRSTRTQAVFENPPKPVDGLFHPPDGPGLGLRNEAEPAKRRVDG